MIYGLVGNDSLFGGSGEDIFVPGPGNDNVYARSNNEGGGMKTFMWNIGDGHDIIYYYNAAHKAGDGLGVLRFGAGISADDIDVRPDANGRTVFALRDGSGSVTFYYTDRIGLEYQLDEIHFADGTIWKWADTLGRKILRGTDNNDTLKSYSRAGEKVTVYGLAGNDSLFGGSGEDIFVPGPGNDNVYARSNTSTEGGGMKTFVWNAGDGHDIIYYHSAAHRAGDGMGVLRFGPNIGAEDVKVRLNASGSTVFALRDGSVTIFYSNRLGIEFQLDEICFSDGTIWKWGTMPGQ